MDFPCFTPGRRKLSSAAVDDEKIISKLHLRYRNFIRSLVTYDRTEFSELFGLGANTGEEITIRRVDNRVTELTDAQSDETNICDKRTTVFYPRTARNRDKEWVYIVNDSEYVQAVTSEKCR